jgi:rSAM/selenodomain-associated transferase 1
MNKNALLIFTRNPEPGKVKTRLAKTVGDQTALEIYKFLLQHTVEITTPLEATKFVCYSESIQDRDVWNPKKFKKQLQEGANLGIRMQNAFKRAFNNRYARVVIIGSDLYDITTEHIEEAFVKLETNDVVIGPAEDGGYYLLGLNNMIPEIFENKDWGTATVLEATLEQLKNYKIHQLEMLNDVDVYADIEHHPAFSSFLKPTKQ